MDNVKHLENIEDIKAVVEASDIERNIKLKITNITFAEYLTIPVDNKKY